ncbi:MAG: tRNA 2-thiouridine(34) synthase MnmA [Flavobacteriales bacterium]|nr:tRNA 2-thiouridine(34) synthase MnmA [Flavobacteriales bacterium]
MRVVVGLSGGVDSSVAALQLQREGHEVIGIFMRNWVDDTVTIDNACPWVDDANDALLVAQHLGIPFQVIDLSDAYKARIVDHMFAEYAAGRTPNPDVLCNREIKFDLFRQAAHQLGADAVATGHYCRKATTPDGMHRLLAGRDGNKDQSYFLCQVTQAQLSDALFPVGELEKPVVRRIAAEAKLPTAQKKDSQGLCFVGKVKLPEFLQQQLEVQHGPIVEVPAEGVIPGANPWDEPSFDLGQGREVGTHPGAHFFTIGQRRGLNVGGHVEPLFVIGKDMSTNTLYVGESDRHPGLHRQGLAMAEDQVHWIRPDRALEAPFDSMRVKARFRYRQPLQEAELRRTSDGYHLLFDAPQSGVAPGQFAAWHDAETGEEVLGSGVIS